MKTLVILSQKGGTGKTALAVNLAAAAIARRQKVIIIDLDTQVSASEWGDQRDGRAPEIIASPPARLRHQLEACAQKGADLVIVDTPARLDNSAADIARLADFIIAPCKPALVDLRAVVSTSGLVKGTDVPFVVVLNQTPARGQLAQDALGALADLDIEIAPVEIKNRVAFIHAFNNGLAVVEYEPAGKAAEEIKALYTFITKKIGSQQNGKDKLNRSVA